jgi:hypothetical protein
MPRGRQRDTGTSHMPSQRRLRIGEPVRLATAALAVTLVTLSPAFAEVCDKVVGEHWRPGHGPAAAKIKWLGYFGAAFFAIVGLLDLFASILPITDDVLLAAVQEGCLALRAESYALGLGATVLLALLYGAAAYGFARSQRAAKTAVTT